MKGLEEHAALLRGMALKPCPFCGGQPYIDSCDRLINIGCEVCGYHRYFHGLVQSELITDVVVSRSKQNGLPQEWYDKDAYEKAVAFWNRRTNMGLPEPPKEGTENVD